MKKLVLLAGLLSLNIHAHKEIVRIVNQTNCRYFVHFLRSFDAAKNDNRHAFVAQPQSRREVCLPADVIDPSERRAGVSIYLGKKIKAGEEEESAWLYLAKDSNPSVLTIKNLPRTIMVESRPGILTMTLWKHQE